MTLWHPILSVSCEMPDFSLDEEEAVDLLEEIQKQLKKRQWGEAIRLEIESNVDKQLLKILKKELSISSEDIFQISGPLDLTFLMKMYGLDGFDHLRLRNTHRSLFRN